MARYVVTLFAFTGIAASVFVNISAASFILCSSNFQVTTIANWCSTNGRSSLQLYQSGRSVKRFSFKFSILEFRRKTNACER